MIRWNFEVKDHRILILGTGSNPREGVLVSLNTTDVVGLQRCAQHALFAYVRKYGSLELESGRPEGDGEDVDGNQR